MKYFLLLLFSLIALASRGQVTPPTNIPVHDAVMIRSDGRFYLFCTGRGISAWSSSDLKNRKKEDDSLAAGPAWATQAIPGFKNHIWAPDISRWNGLYYLYYSVSAFGKNTSANSVATKKTLNSQINLPTVASLIPFVRLKGPTT